MVLVTGELPKAWTPDALEEWRQREMAALQPQPERSLSEQILGGVHTAKRTRRLFLLAWIVVGMIIVITASVVWWAVSWPFKRLGGRRNDG